MIYFGALVSFYFIATYIVFSTTKKSSITVNWRCFFIFHYREIFTTNWAGNTNWKNSFCKIGQKGFYKVRKTFMTKWDKKVGANIANHATYIFDGENLKRYLTSFNPTFLHTWRFFSFYKRFSTDNWSFVQRISISPS